MEVEPGTLTNFMVSADCMSTTTFARGPENISLPSGSRSWPPQSSRSCPKQVRQRASTRVHEPLRSDADRQCRFAAACHHMLYKTYLITPHCVKKELLNTYAERQSTIRCSKHGNQWVLCVKNVACRAGHVPSKDETHRCHGIVHNLIDAVRDPHFAPSLQGVDLHSGDCKAGLLGTRRSPETLCWQWPHVVWSLRDLKGRRTVAAAF